MDGVARRQAERELYDLNKIAQLQNDEIDRLNSELDAILKEIAAAEDRVDNSAEQRQRIRDLRQEIALIPAQTSQKKSQLISIHTKRLTDLRTRHTQRLNALRREHQQHEHTETSESEPTDEMISSINATRSKIADLLHMKSEQRELAIKAKLETISAQVERDRQRITQLEQANDQLRQEIDQARSDNNAKITQLQLPNPDTDAADEDEKLVLAKADLMMDEDIFRKEAQKLIDEMNARITAQRNRITQAQTAIDSHQSEDTDKLRQATQEKQKLTQLNEHLQLEKLARQELHASSPPRIDIEKREAIATKLAKTRETLFSAQQEHTALLTEIRRLNYMLYGRKAPSDLFKKYYIS